MELIDIHLIHELPQLPAASAIACFDQRLFLIGDSSQYVHMIDKDGDHRRFPLLPDVDPAAEPLPKKHKADFEGLALDSAHGDGALLVLPSGSKRNRFLGARVDLGTARYAVTPVDFAPLFEQVMAHAHIGEKDLNIEGGGSWGPQRWFLLNRGNGPKAKNLVVILEGGDLPHALPVAHHRLELPTIDGIAATTTDGCIIGDMLYVVAAAEGSACTYSDGEVAGSLIARYDLASFALKDWCRLPGTTKYEGISTMEDVNEAAGCQTLVLCSDHDDPLRPGGVYQAVLRMDHC